MGRKKKTPAGAAPDAARLAARGVDGVEPLDALRRLSAQWGDDPEIDAWAVERAAGLQDPAVGALLHELEERSADKRVRREIKRALYRLQQRGLWQPPDAPAPPRTRDLMGPAEDAPQAWLSPIDPTGTRLVWMARTTAGAVATLSAVVNEDQGIREFHSGKTTRKALRESHREIAQRSGIPLVEAPWAWVLESLRTAFERTEKGRFPEVPNVLSTLAPRAPVEPPAPPIEARLDRAEVAGDEEALAASAALLGEREVGTWVLPISWLEETLEKLSEADGSLLVVSPAATEERRREMVERAVDQILDPADRRTRFADRLEESAFLLVERDAAPSARQAFAASIAARAGTPIARIPILAEITRRSLALAFQARAQKGQEDAQSSLVLTPQQAMAEQQRRGRRGPG